MIINSKLSTQGKAEITGHELYGHVYMDILNLNRSHETNGMKEVNINLKNSIIDSMKEIQKYFNK